MVEITIATEKDIPVIEDILLDTVNWLESISKPLWTKDQVSWTRLSRNFTPSDFYIAYIEGIPFACMALIGSDPAFWPDVGNGTSLFIHKLAVKRAAAGKGVSIALLDYAKNECLQRKIPDLCLDCSALIPKLRSFYECNGFICVGERVVYKKYPTAFYIYHVSDSVTLENKN